MKKAIAWLSLASILCLALGTKLIAKQRATAKRFILLEEKANGLPFSSAILTGNTLYISGQLAINPASGKFENGTMTQQTERILANIKILLGKAGMTCADVVQTTVYLSDFNEFTEFNEAYKKSFQINPPTRATVQVAKLARDAKVEISAIAVK